MELYIEEVTFDEYGSITSLSLNSTIAVSPVRLAAFIDEFNQQRWAIAKERREREAGSDQ